MTSALPDTSFLSHALLPSQQTPESTAALRQALDDGDELVATATVVIEFFSLLRKLSNRGVLSVTESDAIRQRVTATIARFVAVTEHDVHAGYRLASRLGQSDTFDATGYVVASRSGMQFWVSDRRFANAASAEGLDGVRFLP